MNKKHTLLILNLLIITLLRAATEVVPTCYTEFLNTPGTAKLPDYSWAGYHLGRDSIPTVKGKVFDVTKYGAVPNDTVEDFDGVKAAVDAAVAAGGGIVYFPKGKFLMNEMVGRKIGIVIPGPNVILRGAGSGTDGTELFMKNYMLQTDTTKLYSVPALFQFYEYKSSTLKTQISADVKRGDFKIIVANGATLQVGDMIKIGMTNPAANNDLLCGLSPYPEWTTTINSGITIMEKHKVAAINGNEVTLCEPININMTAAYGWDVSTRSLSPGLGVEDIWFHGNFHETVVHHLNFIHDFGWNFISMSGASNGFMRRLRFTDVNSGIALSDSYACSIMHIRFDGNPGHMCVENNGGCYGTLIAYVEDATNAPGFIHGPGPSVSSSATVIWRYVGNTRSGFDVHASYPYFTLGDVCTGKFIGNGGDAMVCPNHGKDFTYWNHKEIGKFTNIAFWENHLNPPYGNFVKMVKPNVIGWQGTSTFDTSTLNIYESYGKVVSPESLYEAQLTLRLGALPTWITAAKKEWTSYQSKKEWTTNVNGGISQNTVNRYVSPTGTGTGTSWLDAGALQDVQALATAGDNIFLKSGTYTLASTFTTNPLVNYYGGFKGDEINPTDRDLADLDGNGITEPWEFVFPTVLNSMVSNGTTNTVTAININNAGYDFDGLTLTHIGSASSTGVLRSINVSGATNFSNNTIKNSVVTTSWSTAGSGPYSVFFISTGIINNCLFEKNNMTFNAAVDVATYPFISVLGGTNSQFSNSIVRNNIVTANWGSLLTNAGLRSMLMVVVPGSAGIIPTVKNCIIHNNELNYSCLTAGKTTVSVGAAVQLHYGGALGAIISDSIYNCTIANNKATNITNAGLRFTQGAYTAHYAANNVCWNNKSVVNGVTTISNLAQNGTLTAPSLLSNNFSNGGGLNNNSTVVVNANASLAALNTGANAPMFKSPTTVIGAAWSTADSTAIKQSVWRLMAGSNLIAKGILANVGQKDKSGVDFAATPSVGAYEFIPVVIDALGINQNDLLPITVEKGHIVANEDLQLSVLNMLGVEVWKGSLKNGERVTLPSSVYLVKMTTVRGFNTQKIII